MKDFNQFREEHPILLNSILIALAAVAVVYIALLFIDVFTAHGEECRVPNVRNMSLEQAIATIEQAGLKWEISEYQDDSDHLFACERDGASQNRLA